MLWIVILVELHRDYGPNKIEKARPCLLEKELIMLGYLKVWRNVLQIRRMEFWRAMWKLLMDSWNKDPWNVDVANWFARSRICRFIFATGGVGFQLCFACKYFGCFQASIIPGSLNYPVGGMKQCKCMVILKDMSLIIVPLFGLVIEWPLLFEHWVVVSWYTSPATSKKTHRHRWTIWWKEASRVHKSTVWPV